MGTRNTPQQSRKDAAAYRDRLKARGLVYVPVWCRPEDVGAVKAFDRRKEQKQ